MKNILFAFAFALLGSTCTFAQEPQPPMTAQTPAAAPKTAAPPPFAPEPKTAHSVVVLDGRICVQSVTTSVVSVTAEQITAKIEEIETEIKASTEKHEKEQAARRERVAELSRIVVQVQRQEKKAATAKKE